MTLSRRCTVPRCDALQTFYLGRYREIHAPQDTQDCVVSITDESEALDTYVTDMDPTREPLLRLPMRAAIVTI